METTRLILEITKIPFGSEMGFKFNLTGENVSINCIRKVTAANYTQFKDTLMQVSDYVSDFKADKIDNSTYRRGISGWLNRVSTMIRDEFMPELEKDKTGFVEKMIQLEAGVRNREKQVVLSLITNDYLIPYWLAKPYRYQTNTENLEECWATLYSIGFLPLSTHQDGRIKAHIKNDNRIALISRPSNNLEKAKQVILSDSLKEKLDIKDGHENLSNSEVENLFGLTPRQVQSFIKDRQVIFYYGHFNLDENNPGQSSLETLYPYGRSRDGLVRSYELTLESIQEFLEGKVLLLDACRSAGIPYFGTKAKQDEGREDSASTDFPNPDSTLPDFFLHNRIVCIGTIYPIFDDAAVDFMACFIKNLSSGLEIGEAVRASRLDLREKRRSEFDWASYILIGPPDMTLEI